MRYLTIFTPDPKTAGVPPTAEHMAAMGQLIDEFTSRGQLLSTGALLPMSPAGARVSRTNGSITVIDGPYAEAKEVIVGFALLEADSRAEVLELVKRFLHVAGDGESVVHQIMEPQPECAGA